MRSGSVGLSDARELGVLRQRVSDEGIPTLTSMVNALDGYAEGGRVVRTTEDELTDDGTVRRTTIAPVRQSSLPFVDRLFHTVASPAITYLLLLVGLALLVFEFFTAGVGVAGVVGAGALVLAFSGLAALPARGWAVGLIIASMFAFAVDVQVGIPRFWTAVGVVGTVVGSLWLFEPLPGATLRPSWITLLAGIGGIVLAFVVGMPSMVRTRFATPTIGREWLLGELGEVVVAVDPDGVVKVGEGPGGRARTEQRRYRPDRRCESSPSMGSPSRSSRSKGRRATTVTGVDRPTTHPRTTPNNVFPGSEPCVNTVVPTLRRRGAVPTVCRVVTGNLQWQRAALCRGDAGRDFYPPFGGERKRDRKARELRAKAVCGSCPVRARMPRSCRQLRRALRRLGRPHLRRTPHLAPFGVVIPRWAGARHRYW